MRNERRIIIGFIFLITGTYFLASGLAEAQEGALAPQYRAQDLSSKDSSLEEFRGSVILINGWATWCEPCRDEMPALQKLFEEYSEEGLVVIGVSLDGAGSRDLIRGFTDHMGITYPIWHDPADTFSRTFRAMGVPHSVLIDREGFIIHEWRGQFDPMDEDTRIRVEAGLGLIDLPSEHLSNLQTIGFTVAFAAGLLSFLSPCVLPLVPAYTTFITGLSLKDVSSNYQGNADKTHSRLQTRNVVIKRGGLFVIGFSSVFIALGTSVGLLGTIFMEITPWIERIGGVILIFFGLHLLNILHISRLERQLKFNPSPNKTKNFGALIVGMTFAAGWTPCIGPILAGILTIAAASTSVGTGALLLTAYSAGLAIPFLISAFAADRFLIFFKKIKRWLPWIERGSGILLIGLGILLLTGSMTLLADMFSDTLIIDIFSN